MSNSRYKYHPILIISGMMMLILIGAGLLHESRMQSPAERHHPSLDHKKDVPGPDLYPSEWAWERRTFPFGKADAAAYRQEMQKAQSMRAEAAPLKLQQAAVNFAGPTNVGGRVSDIEFNPLDPNIVYAGGATGGVFKSTDMGSTWFPIFDDQANLNIGDIAVDPVHPDTIYVGTGEANGGHNNFPGGGVYKSIDGGDTWQLLGLENTAAIGRIVIDPDNTERVFLAATGAYFLPNPERGVYLSTDGGASWAHSLFISDSTGAIDIIMDPNDPTRLMAAMWERVRRPNSSHLFGPTSGLYRSTNGGGTWEELSAANGLPNPNTTNVGRIGLALYQSNTDIAYALYNNGANLTGIFKTTNFGTSWTDADPLNRLGSGSGFSWYFGQVRVKPDDEDIIYVLDQSFRRTSNGGTSWPTVSGSNFHVDHHALAFHPGNPNFILEGNDGGINISQNAGASWTKVAELPVTQFYEIGLDRTNPQRLYGGTQDNSTVRTLTGALNDWNVIFGGDGFYTIVDPVNPNIIYAESQFGNLGKSFNLGSSFQSATSGISGSEPTNWSTPVVMDPNNNQILYYGTNRVYRTTNGASSWSAISPDLTTDPGPRLGTVTTIGVSPPNSDIIWAGTDESNIWVTTNGGSNWTNVSSTLPFRWVTRVIPDPLDENIAYATFSGLKWKDPEPHVFRTTDLGQTWDGISSNLPDAPINALAVDPMNTNNLFTGSDLGAYFSTNLGASWQYISSDFPMVSVYDMKVHETAHYLAIGTHARSMYTMDLDQLAGQFNVAVAAGWNIVGLPLDVSDSSAAALYPSHMTNTLFSYDGTYQMETHLTPGEGFWLNFTEMQSIPISGEARNSIAIDLDAGWNMISGPSCNVAVSAISDPGGIIVGSIFGFDGVYNTVTTINQGSGYWVNASTAGTITLTCTAPVEKQASKISDGQTDLSGFSRLQISANGTASQTLYFNGRLTDSESQQRYSLPPVPPAGMFDARFEGDYRLIEDGTATIRLRAAQYPVVIRAENLPADAANFVLKEIAGKNRIYHALENGKVIEIVNPAVRTLRLTTSTDAVPLTFNVHQNFPNPFNPSTRIAYELPENSAVEIVIFNNLGQRVKTLLNGQQEAGRQQVVWDGTDDAGIAVGSGIYFYRISAETNQMTRKMMLLR